MSITATGGPWSRRPLTGACMTRPGGDLRCAFKPAKEAARRGVLERFATARQARIGHEVFVGVERFLARCGLYARGTAVRQETPALLIVHEIRHHDLPQNLFVHGGVENGAKYLNPAVKITRHHVGRGNVNRGLGVRQKMAGAKAEDAAVLEKPADNRLDPDIFRQ